MKGRVDLDGAWDKTFQIRRGIGVGHDPPNKYDTFPSETGKSAGTKNLFQASTELLFRVPVTGGKIG